MDAAVLVPGAGGGGQGEESVSGWSVGRGVWGQGEMIIIYGRRGSVGASLGAWCRST